MSLPATISADLAALRAAYIAAGPIDKAPPLVFAKVDQMAFTLIAALDGQVALVGAALDGFAPKVSATATATVLTQALVNANDELDAYEARSYVGRFAASIELTEGFGQYFASRAPLEIKSTQHAVLNFMDNRQTALLVALV